MNIKGENRERRLDKNKRRYPPAKGPLGLPDGERDEDRKAEDRRIAQLVRDARKGKLQMQNERITP